MTDKVCPKCKGQNFVIFDTVTTTYIYEVTEGYVTPEGEDSDYQEHIKRSADAKTADTDGTPKD